MYARRRASKAVRLNSAGEILPQKLLAPAPLGGVAAQVQGGGVREPTSQEPPPDSQDEASDSRHGIREPVARSRVGAERLGAHVPGPLHGRVAAFLIDSALGYGIAFLYVNFTTFQIVSQLYVGGAEENAMLDLARSSTRSSWTIWAVVSALTFFYRWSTQSIFGWTPGKRVLGLWIVGSDRLSARSARVLVREIALAPGVVFSVLSIDYILSVLAQPFLATRVIGLGPLNFALPIAMLTFTFWRLDRRGLHDLIGQTRVARSVSGQMSVPSRQAASVLVRRILAFAIDFLFGLVIIFAAGFALGSAAMILAIVLPVLNRTLLPATVGFTIGKRVMGLRTARADGHRAGALQILVREVVLLVLLYAANLVTILGGWVPATGLMALFLLSLVILRTDRRSLHELASDTFVVLSSSIGGTEASARSVSPQV